MGGCDGFSALEKLVPQFDGYDIFGLIPVKMDSEVSWNAGLFYIDGSLYANDYSGVTCGYQYWNKGKDLINNYAGQNKKDTTKKTTLIDEKLLVEFRVQFTSSDKEIDAASPKLKGLEKVSYYKVGAILKYTAGNYTKPAEAASYQTKVRELGYKDAFVVAFKNGQRIDYKEALKLVK